MWSALAQAKGGKCITHDALQFEGAMSSKVGIAHTEAFGNRFAQFSKRGLLHGGIGEQVHNHLTHVYCFAGTTAWLLNNNHCVWAGIPCWGSQGRRLPVPCGEPVAVGDCLGVGFKLKFTQCLFPLQVDMGIHAC